MPLRLSKSLALVVFSFAVACGGPQATSPSPDVPESSSAQAPSAAPAEANDTARAGRASVFVFHMMSDFDAFKKYFEDGAADRAKAGVKGYLLSKLDDGRVVVHLFADDVAVVEDALRSPEMQKFLDRKGAPETSIVWVTRDVLVTVPPAPPSGDTYSLYLKLKVGDFAALERGFRERYAVFAEHGVIAQGLHQSTANDAIAILHFLGTAKDKLEALPQRKEFAELMALAKNAEDVKPLVGIDVARDRPK